MIDYNGLLIAANLAYLNNKGVVTMKPREWILFFDESDFVIDGVGVEKNVRKFDLKAYADGTESKDNERKTYHVLQM